MHVARPNYRCSCHFVKNRETVNLPDLLSILTKNGPYHPHWLNTKLKKKVTVDSVPCDNVPNSY